MSRQNPGMTNETKETKETKETNETKEFIEICDPEKISMDKKSVQKKALEYILEHPAAEIDFYATPVNFLAFTADNQDLLLHALMHPCMLRRTDHHLFGKLIFEALGDVLVEKYNAIDVAIKIQYKMTIRYFVTFIHNYVYRDPVMPKLSHPDSFFCQQNPINPVALFDFYFRDYPRKELWRMFYDVDKQRAKNKYGWVNQEIKEPGFLKGVCKGFIFLKQTLNFPLSDELIEVLHTKVLLLSTDKPAEKNYLANFRLNGVTFGIVHTYNSTLKGLIELQALPGYGKYFYLEKKERGYLMICPARLDIRVAVKITVTIYLNKINDPIITPIQRLFAIIDLIKTLILIHPFYDANCRTLCTLLSMRELMRNGFPPAILNDPNRFAGYSREECLVELIHGMENFELIKDDIFDETVFGKSTDEIIDLIENHANEVKRKVLEAKLTEWEKIQLQFEKENIGIEDRPNTVQTPGM